MKLLAIRKKIQKIIKINLIQIIELKIKIIYKKKVVFFNKNNINNKDINHYDLNINKINNINEVYINTDLNLKILKL